MATNNKRFVAKNGLDNNNQTITNIGAAGTSLGLSGSGDLTIAISGTATLTIPSGSDTLVTLSGVQTLTNKTISGTNNTISNIGNSSLTNSTISGKSLGTNLDSLTIGTGLSGSSYNGSTPVTIAIDSTVATLSGEQTLTNKTLTTPIIAEIDNASDITLDAGGDIILDADGADIFLKDGGTTFGALSQSGGELLIKSGATPTTALTLSGENVVVSGNLTVSGTTFTVNSNTVNIGDNIITLNSDETGTPSQDAGIEIERGTSPNVTLIWDEANDRWTVGTQTFVAGTFSGALSGNATTATTAGTVTTAAQPNITSLGTLTGLTVSGNTYLATTSGNVGIGTASPSNLLHLKAATNPVIRLEGASDSGYLDYNGTRLQLSGGGGSMYFVTGNTEKMRLDASGNLVVDTNTLYVDAVNNRVGIGTTTPDQALTMEGGVGFNRVDSDLTPASDSKGLIYVRQNGTGTQEELRYLARNHAWFSHAGTRWMTLDASGNLGLGVTPSAWGAGVKAFQFGARAAAYSSSAAITAISNNLYFDGTVNKLIEAAAGARYYQNANSHVWDLVASGAAGSNAAITQAMTLDASGNLGIGTASPVAKLHVQGSAVYLSTTDDYASGTTGSGLIVARGAATGNTYSQIYGVQAGGTSYANLVVPGGNVGIGVTNPATKLHVVGTTFFSIASNTDVGGRIYGYNDTATNLYAGGLKFQSFNFNGASYVWSDVMTINGAGNVGIGTTSPSVKLHVVDGGIRAQGAGSQIDTSPSGGAFRFYDGSTFYGGLGMSGWAGISPSTDIVMYLTSGVNYRITSGTTTRLYVQDSTGNVGIGTTSPGVSLDVNGVIRSRTGVFQLNDGSSTGGGLYFYKTITGSGSDLSPSLFAETGMGIYFMTNGSASTKMYLSTTGILSLYNELQFNSTTYIRSNNEFQFLTIGGSAQNGRFKGIQVSDSYSGAIPANGILFGTDTTWTRYTANGLRASGAISALNWFYVDATGYGVYWSPAGSGIYATTGTQYLQFYSNSVPSGIMFRTSYGGTAIGYVYYDSVAFGLLWAGGWSVRTISGGGELYGNWVTTGTLQSTIYYDYNNTSYYADLSSTGDSIRAAGNIIAYYSDERLKNIEHNITDAVSKVMSLNGFYYTPNEIAQQLGYKEKREVGLSAQEVEKVLPEIIKEAPIDSRYKTLDYSRLVPLLVEAIKELKKENELLTSRINNITGESQ